MSNYKKYIENAEFRLSKGNKPEAIHFYKKAITSLFATIDKLSNAVCDEVVDESMLNDVFEDVLKHKK